MYKTFTGETNGAGPARPQSPETPSGDFWSKFRTFEQEWRVAFTAVGQGFDRVHFCTWEMVLSYVGTYLRQIS
jgi:hypothetical protein